MRILPVRIGVMPPARRRAALRLAAAIAALATLAGCVSAAELRQQDENQCAGYGFKPGTDAFASCLQQEELARRYGAWQQMPAYWYPPYGWYAPSPLLPSR
ncbi:MAG: hypothetical protein KGL11_01990 [Alphaproteobacteria bacterium]|nr:hypothetical protein [Alphaproteobacteria bacterium]